MGTNVNQLLHLRSFVFKTYHEWFADIWYQMRNIFPKTSSQYLHNLPKNFTTVSHGKIPHSQEHVFTRYSFVWYISKTNFLANNKYHIGLPIIVVETFFNGPPEVFFWFSFPREYWNSCFCKCSCYFILLIRNITLVYTVKINGETSSLIEYEQPAWKKTNQPFPAVCSKSFWVCEYGLRK